MGGGGHSLIWPIWVCAAEQGMVFRLLSLTGCPFGPEAMNRGCEFWRCAVYVCDKAFFFNITEFYSVSNLKKQSLTGYEKSLLS